MRSELPHSALVVGDIVEDRIRNDPGFPFSARRMLRTLNGEIGKLSPNTSSVMPPPPTNQPPTAKATNDAYTGLLSISLFALIGACLLLYRDISQYPESKPPSVSKTASDAQGACCRVQDAKPKEYAESRTTQ